jgi:hypothetical protein
MNYGGAGASDTFVVSDNIDLSDVKLDIKLSDHELHSEHYWDTGRNK